MKYSKILTMQVNVTNRLEVAQGIENLARLKQGGYVCVSNVHMCMEVFDDDAFAKIVNNADFTIPDGRPLFWAQRLLGFAEAQQVRGQDIMNLLCQRSIENGLNIGLYGGSSDEIIAIVKSNLSKIYPGISIPYTYSPPFRALSDSELRTVQADLSNAKVDLLFVGIGCPKQEQWMAYNKDSFSGVMLGVGAAFDFIAGSKQHAPVFIQQLGMEWLFRFCSEPKRLWHRYLKQNPRFLYYFMKQLLVKTLSSRNSNPKS